MSGPYRLHLVDGRPVVERIDAPDAPPVVAPRPVLGRAWLALLEMGPEDLALLEAADDLAARDAERREWARRCRDLQRNLGPR
jgi:hypothetical protein